MTRSQKGHFAAKHPPGTTVDSRITAALKQKAEDFSITCIQAHAVAESLSVSPRDVGTAIDLQEGRIRKCQLGLFGYGDRGKMVQTAQTIAPDLKAAIESSQDEKRRLTCIQAWGIADNLSVSRLAVSNACEALGIKIVDCQLGAF